MERFLRILGHVKVEALVSGAHKEASDDGDQEDMIH